MTLSKGSPAMKIIDNKKDYYDYLSGVYGVDPLAVYDRRGSMTWGQYRDRFSVFVDTARIKNDLFVPKNRSWWAKDNRYFLCVEAGKTQFFIMAERTLPKEGSTEVTITRLLLGTRMVNRKHSQAPLAVFECHVNTGVLQGAPPDLSRVTYWHERKWYFHHRKITEEPLVINPILDGSFIVSIIPAKEIWEALYEYLISLNDKEIIDNRPDKLKIEAAGFDTKTSFRNIKD